MPRRFPLGRPGQSRAVSVHAATPRGVATPATLRRVLAPILGPDLLVLFVGINPSLRSAEVGHHFARPGNRFYPALHAAGFTPRRLLPAEQGELATFGLGITNMAPRATARAD